MFKRQIQYAWPALSVLLIFAAMLIAFPPSPASNGGTPTVREGAKIYDSEPPNASAEPPIVPEPPRIATWLIYPDGKQDLIRLDRPIAAGDELGTTTPKVHVWRVKQIRYQLFDTYTARLIYVEELGQNRER